MTQLWFIVCILLAFHVYGEGQVETNTQKFLRLALNATHPFKSDKVQGHSYHEMYGVYLLPLIERIHSVENRGFKLFEIGLGCSSPNKKKGVDIWRSLLTQPEDEIWVAEFRAKCAQKMIQSGMVPTGVHVVTGNQSDVADLARWHNESRGGFDVIIDDGGHKNMQIYNSIDFLFRHSLAPGGLYFVEDLQVGRDATHEDSHGAYVFADVVKDWVEQLLIPNKSPDQQPRHWTHPILPGIKWISCQHEACVIAKCSRDDSAYCS